MAEESQENKKQPSVEVRLHAEVRIIEQIKRIRKHKDTNKDYQKEKTINKKNYGKKRAIRQRNYRKRD